MNTPNFHRPLGQLARVLLPLSLFLTQALTSGDCSAEEIEVSVCHPGSVSGYQSEVLTTAVKQCVSSCLMDNKWYRPDRSTELCASKCACSPLTTELYTSANSKLDSLDIVAVQVADQNGIVLPLNAVTKLVVSAKVASRNDAPEVILRHDFENHQRAKGDYVLVQIDRMALGAAPGEVIELKVSVNPLLPATRAIAAVIARPEVDARPATEFLPALPGVPRVAARRAIPALPARGGNPVVRSFYLKLNNSWEAYGGNANSNSSINSHGREKLGFWVPLGLFGTHFSKVGDEGMLLAITPFAVAYGSKIHVTPSFELGISGFLGYTLSSSPTEEDPNTNTTSWQTGSLGVLLEINSRILLGFGYSIDSRKIFENATAPSPYQHPGSMLVVGIPLNLLAL